ncbi:unnamed protein product [Periconia digitata]|uniref:Uncharacterized protein n=1 Tax=Periconia digitata TaxID=1303443 RepID=A0A9W4XUU5_9PLEO|nr:unnamed protein product [Periconia digitata]
MPAERRPTYPTLAKPMKTERTHEENQERAYIAASRRSDRSLEARIESARRASDIHKKRTGRGLRVTEQDVINEEMYEEEDDDLPTQYQRLNAHLHTSSQVFNKKLQDYIAAQTGVRHMFMQQQFPDPNPQQYAAHQFQQNGQMPMMYQPMYPSQSFSPTTPTFIHSGVSYNPQLLQQHQSFRQAPYSIPSRNKMHQRSASVTTPLAMPSPGMPLQQVKPTVTTPDADVNRRMSLPQNITEPQPAAGEARPSLSRASTGKGVQKSAVTADNTQNASTTTPKSDQAKTPVKSEHTTPTDYQFPQLPFDPSSQVFNMSPFALSLPPESQQMVGPALDPQDPRTRLLMEGSENLAQPNMGTYTYNPNVSPKSARSGKGANQTPTTTQSSGMSQTLAPDTGIKMNTSMENSGAITPTLGSMNDMFINPSLFAPNGPGYSGYFDPYQMPDTKLFNDPSFSETFEDSTFLNWD